MPIFYVILNKYKSLCDKKNNNNFYIKIISKLRVK